MGEVEVTFDLKTAGSNEKLTTNVDLSNNAVEVRKSLREYIVRKSTRDFDVIHLARVLFLYLFYVSLVM